MKIPQLISLRLRQAKFNKNTVYQLSMKYRKKPGFFKQPGFYGVLRRFFLQKSVYAALMMAACLMMSAYEAEGAERAIQLSYLQNQVLLDPITSSELLGGPDSQALPVQGDIRAQRLLVEEISRPLPSVWQIRVPAKVALGSLRVQYQLTAANGNPGRLSHINFPKAEILVNLQPLPPRIIEQEEVVIEEEEGVSVNTTTAQTPPLKRVVNIQRFNSIEGGVTISFHPSQIQYAGTYAGTLTILIHGL